MSDNSLRRLEAELGLAGLALQFGAAVSRSAEPGRALQLAAGVLRASAETGQLAAAWERRPAEVARVLSTLCGAAPFFARVLCRHPAWLPELAMEHLSTPRAAADYKGRLARRLDRTAADVADVLRAFKYYELARITVRDLSADLVPPARAGEPLAELSHLADATLERALARAALTLERTCGAPRWRTARAEERELAFCVLGLGKLGAEELNYSSDVDLVYVFESPPETSGEHLEGGPQGLTPVEYFTRLAQEFGQLVGQTTGEGFLYRIDLDLRPEGSAGPLVVSSDVLARYYDSWAATWEKAAFMKARPVAGHHGFGWRVIRSIDPMIYRSSMDLAGVAAIKQMKEKIERAKERKAGAFDVKTGSGGIRDVELVAQALQLLHGGRIPQVRERSTQGALIALGQVGVLPDREASDLLAAYRFLRRVENRLQMEYERQIHRLPLGPEAVQRLARSMGFLGNDAVAAFECSLDDHRQRIGQTFDSLFHEAAGEQIVKLFDRNITSLSHGPVTRQMIEHLATQLARAIEDTADPERAMNNLDRFIHGVGARTFFYGLLLDRPELVPRLAALFAASEYLSGYLATHPRLIEPIFDDPNVLVLAGEELVGAPAAIRAELEREGGRDKIERGLDALRLFHNRELVNVGLLDLAGKITPVEAERGLTDIAEVCVKEGLRVACAEIERRPGGVPAVAEKGEFLVVGMGKLASRELTYGSDLDVIFLYDVEGAAELELLEAQEHYVRLAQKLIWALQTRTPEGVCYLIDARLRPSGNQGLLVTQLASFGRYHAASAQMWERQALLRARPVAGGEHLARSFEGLRREILLRPAPANLGRELHRVRLRMESELAQETKQRHDFKTGRGGLLDVESVVQYLQLRHAVRHDELLAVAGTGAQLARLERLGLLEEADAETLRRGWEFLQLLSSRLRIVENRSISDLDEERGDLDALARRLGYAGTEREASARRALLENYQWHTNAIRDVYLRVLGVQGASSPLKDRCGRENARR